MGGISGSKSKSSSEQSAYGYSGSESLSQSISQGRSAGQATSFQDLAFGDIFGAMYGDAAGAAGRAAGLVPELQGQAGALFSGGMGFLDQLGGGAGADYLNQRLTGPGQADEQIGQLGEDLSRFFGEQLNPQITSQHVAGGTLGGGRQGVAQGLAAEGVAGQFARGATGIRQAEQAQRDQLAGQAAGITQQGAASGLQALPGLYGLAEAGALAELSPYGALAGILGGPTTLTQSQSTQFSEDQAIAQAISSMFGEDFSSGSSKSKSGSFGLNIAGS